jgi:hypothetical protein
MLGYGQDDRGSIPDRGNDGKFSPRHLVQTDSGTHPASYRMDTEAIKPGVKPPGREADHSHLVLGLRMHKTILPSLNTSSWRGA